MIWQRILDFYFERPGLALLILGNIVFLTGTVALALTALGLRIRNDRKAARWRTLEGLWETKTLEVVTETAPPETVWAQVAKTDELHFVNFLLRFARRLTGTERKRVDELAAPYLDQLLSQLKARQPERRARAIQTLATLGQRRYHAQIERSLADPAPLVSMVAARSLARRESPDFAVSILSHLHRFGHWRPSFLASMLASVGPAVAPALRKALADPAFDPKIRGLAADALRELNDYAAADVAAEALAATTDRDLQIGTLGLLAQVGRAEHLGAVRAFLTSPEAIVRARAASVLGRIGSAEDVANLAAAFDDPSPWVALRAAEALYERRDPMLKTLAESEHPRAALARQMLKGGAA